MPVEVVTAAALAHVLGDIVVLEVVWYLPRMMGIALESYLVLRPVVELVVEGPSVPWKSETSMFELPSQMKEFVSVSSLQESLLLRVNVERVPVVLVASRDTNVVDVA